MTKTDFEKFLKVCIFLSNLNISRNKLYIQNLQIMCFKMIYNLSIFSESEFFNISKNTLNLTKITKIAHEITKSKYFGDI